ncbi:MAG TPA: hypothetical protein VFO01_04015 [Trebonia sp.]|nr:hypothetical protein [Trebonia sp.]
MATEYGDTHGSQPWPGAQPPYGQPRYGQPRYGQPRYGQPPYGQPRSGQPRSGQPRSGQPPPGQPRYGQPRSGQPPYGQPPYGQPPPGQPRSGQPPYGQLPYSGPPFPGPARPEPPPDLGALARRRRARSVTWALLAVGGIVAAVALFGIVTQGTPRTFTAAQRQQITDWEYGKRWRDLPAGAIFPASVGYHAPAVLNDAPLLTLTAQRVGIAKQASCASAADPAAAAVLDRDGCSAMLRATYVDATDSFVVTVGAAVLPDTAKAKTAFQAIAHADSSSGLGATVGAVRFTGTPAGEFTDRQRQLSGVVSRGTYVVLYTVGYADSRRLQQVSEDSYTDREMTSMGTGVADGVLSALAAPVPSPHCPGAGIPGC